MTTEDPNDASDPGIRRYVITPTKLRRTNPNSQQAAVVALLGLGLLLAGIAFWPLFFVAVPILICSALLRSETYCSRCDSTVRRGSRKCPSCGVTFDR